MNGKSLLLAVCALLVGCEPTPPAAPQVVQITSPGSAEADSEWQVHVVRFKPINTDQNVSTGAPIQSALVAWIGSWQNLELVDFEIAEKNNEITGHDLVIVARKRR